MLRTYLGRIKRSGQFLRKIEQALDLRSKAFSLFFCDFSGQSDLLINELYYLLFRNIIRM